MTIEDLGSKANDQNQSENRHQVNLRLNMSI